MRNGVGVTKQIKRIPDSIMEQYTKWYQIAL